MIANENGLSQVSKDNARTLLGGLLGVAQVNDGATNEQQRVVAALGRHLWSVNPTELHPLEPLEVADGLPDSEMRRRFLQLAIIVQFCRHPATVEQEQRLETYAAAVAIDGPQLDSIRDWITEDAEHATYDYVRRYRQFLTDLSEPEPLQLDADPVMPALRALIDLPEGSLGREFLAFYERNGLTLPGPNTPSPEYYVSHDMNHVIAGYESTGIEEIALGAFKLGMHDTEANWMAFMSNLLIHEAGLLKHGKAAGEQFVPYGGEIYPDAYGQGALHLPGASDVLAEAFVRGSTTTTDFSQIDHLAIAHQPLEEVRAEHGVIARLAF